MSGKKMNIIIIGDSSVGKTCILNRYTKNEYTDKDPTIGVDQISKKVDVNSQEITVSFWDTAGQEVYQSVTSSFYKNADGAMIVFDITSSDSFKNVENWIRQYRENNTKSQTFIIVGNKSDLSSERKVSKEEAKELAQNYETEYFEVSAKNDIDVKETFEQLLAISLEKMQEIISNTIVLNIENNQQNDSKCKC